MDDRNKNKRIKCRETVSLISIFLFAFSVVMMIVYFAKTLIFAFTNPSYTMTEVMIHMVNHTDVEYWAITLIISRLMMYL